MKQIERIIRKMKTMLKKNMQEINFEGLRIDMTGNFNARDVENAVQYELKKKTGTGR